MERILDKSSIDEVLKVYPARRDSLVRLLQAMQSKFGYLSEEVMLAVADYLNLSPSSVYSVATFYAQFKFKPAGRHCIKVCYGTACHVKGAGKVLTELERKLGIKKGETTPDREYTLETEACFGSCALAPLVMIDSEFYGRVTPDSAPDLIGGD